jgi:hypothetical protein
LQNRLPRGSGERPRGPQGEARGPVPGMHHDGGPGPVSLAGAPGGNHHGGGVQPVYSTFRRRGTGDVCPSNWAYPVVSYPAGVSDASGGEPRDTSGAPGEYR